MRISLRILLTVILLHSLTAIVAACDCIIFAEDSSSLTGNVSKARDESDAVFSGTVVSVSPATESDPKSAIIGVKQLWKGIKFSEIKIVTGNDNGDCGFSFKVGHTYLVYAYNYRIGNDYMHRSRDLESVSLATHLCTRTRLLSKVSRSEISALGRTKF